MNIKSILISLLLSLTLIACKEEKKAQQQPEIQKIDPRELFNVELDLVVPKDDSLQLFYKDETNNEWEEGQSVWASIKGSNEIQKVQFLLPKDIIPNDLRIDFGINKIQDSIVVKNFSMKYFDKSFSVKDTLFYQYFQPNEQINWDRKRAVAKMNHNQGVVYDPLCFPREVLKNEIQKIIK